ERDAVDRILERRTVHVLDERIDRLEELHAEALARAIVLGDERALHAPRGLDDVLLAHRGDRARRADAVGAQRLVLRDLADLEPQRAAVVHDAPAMRL